MSIASYYPSTRYIGPVHSTAFFSFDPVKGTFSTEASDLGRTRVHGQLYDDAADLGFLLESHKTHMRVPFVHVRTERDREGEVVADHYEVTSEAVRHDGKLKGLKVVVFND